MVLSYMLGLDPYTVGHTGKMMYTGIKVIVHGMKPADKARTKAIRSRSDYFRYADSFKVH